MTVETGETQVMALAGLDVRSSIDERVSLRLDRARIHVFDAATGRRLRAATDTRGEGRS